VGDGAQGLEVYRGRMHEITLQTWGPDYPDPHTNASTFAMNPDNSDEAGDGLPRLADRLGSGCRAARDDRSGRGGEGQRQAHRDV
jgi:hypothetical protein